MVLSAISRAGGGWEGVKAEGGVMAGERGGRGVAIQYCTYPKQYFCVEMIQMSTLPMQAEFSRH